MGNLFSTNKINSTNKTKYSKSNLKIIKNGMIEDEYYIMNDYKQEINDSIKNYEIHNNDIKKINFPETNLKIKKNYI